MWLVIIFICGVIAGMISYKFVHMQGCAGNLVIIEETDEEPYIFLELNKSDVEQVKKEGAVLLKVVQKRSRK